MLKKFVAPAVLLCMVSISAHAETRCEHILKAFGDQLADVTCFQSTDLTTNNPLTTPANNSIPTLPAFAFTPVTDRGVIAPVVPQSGHPITSRRSGRADPGPHRQRPDRPGAIPSAGCPTTGTVAWLLPARPVRAANSMATLHGATMSCRRVCLRVAEQGRAQSPVHDAGGSPGLPLESLLAALRAISTTTARAAVYALGGATWSRRAELGADGVKSAYGKAAQYTYAVGTSNGGYQVRRALETGVEVFDGGVDWEGTFVDEDAPNLLTDLPPAILNWPDYVASHLIRPAPPRRTSWRPATRPTSYCRRSRRVRARDRSGATTRTRSGK